MSDPDLRSRVIRCIADCLALDTDAVHAEHSLIGDLEADSLDFIDILFAMEQEFAVKLRSADVESFLRADFSEAGLVQGQYLPAPALERLAPWLPALAQAPDPQQVTPSQVFSYITVETFVRIAQSALRA